jgi:hypothetical protein
MDGTRQQGVDGADNGTDFRRLARREVTQGVGRWSSEERGTAGQTDDETPTIVSPAARTRRLASTGPEEAPTLVVPSARRRPRPEWPIGRTQRPRWRRLDCLQPSSLRGRWVAGIATLALLALVLPTVLGVASAFGDYADIRALGESGLHHLEAARDDLGGLTLLGSLVGGSAAAPANAPYSLLVQRQAGTFYQTVVNIQPSPKLKKAGDKAVQFTAVLGTNTAVRLGPESSTPAATPTPSTGSGVSGGGAPASLIPTPQALRAAQAECQAAQQDFQDLQARLDHLGWALSLTSGLPPVGSELSTAQALASIGYHGATLGALYAGAAIPLLTKLHGKSLTGDHQLLSQSDITAIQQTIARSQPTLDALQAQLDGVDVNNLPLSDAQKAELSSVKAELPKLRSVLSQTGVYLNAVAWLLGADQTRNFLLGTLDRTELRASGGFAGNFAILTIQDGQIAPLNLVPVARTDYSGKAWDDGWDTGRRPPAQYSWWPVSDWGLRDANLSADYPTTAQLTMMAYQGECGAACQAAGLPASVDGVIQVTPVAIEHVLQVTGPIEIPDYDVSVTADNLEYEIHYFSLQRWDGSYPPGPNGT